MSRIDLIQFHQTQFIHYRQFLDAARFKSKGHLRFLKEQEVIHLNRYLELTENNPDVLIAAGFVISNNNSTSD